MESFFNEAEKRFVLAEMIKLSQLDVNVLVNFVKAHGIQPDWLHMQLPGGRNMSQCLHAAETMFREPMPPPLISPLKRKSLGDLPDYVSKRQAIASPGEVSPRGFAPGPGLQPATGPHPINIQPRPNGYALAPPAPSPTVSAAPYNPAPTGRRRGRPPKSSQGTWQVSTYQPITPAPIAHPGLHVPQAQQPPPAHPVPDPKSRKKTLPEIAPRPAQVLPTTEAEYQNWRDETYRREYYQVQSTAEPPPPRGDRPTSMYAPILPRPRSPLPPMRELPRPASAEPRQFRATPPANTAEPAKEPQTAAAADGVKT
ncbi:hypothetical protein C8A05DRAFT_16717 [Staphylotrichum tortipilum]|uniref:Uncharacterized protein n=1 Tax=Staphylotrichum tortipilum TaxID=2831512 RepID=A0AAN6MIZ6_9PEZI|nr:hypothetical protein C8A05DRAFT_16717 [Staphylotrichum longicolle]